MPSKIVRWFGIISGAALLLAAPADPGALSAENTWHIALCHVGLDHEPPSLAGLKEELASRGYVDGENLRFDWRNQESEETANEQTTKWVAEGVDLIVAFEDQCVRAARAATSTIPTVFVHALDPVASGYVKSLRQPGGNLTGPVSFLPLISKRLELFKEINPDLNRVLVLTDSNDPSAARQLTEARQTGPMLGIEVIVEEAVISSDLERIFSQLPDGETDGVILASKDLATNQMSVLLGLANKADIAVSAHRKEWLGSGALFSYGPDYAAAGPVAADYVDRILKGADPGELPIDVISEIHFVLNLKRAKEFGLVLPDSLIARADEVIE